MTMQAETVVSLASTGVAALAVATSTLTTILSLRGQRENTRATLEAQQALASIQEKALRERTRGDAIRTQRAALYKVLIVWAEGLLGALYATNAEQPRISPNVWHIDATAETDLDLYASDVMHCVGFSLDWSTAPDSSTHRLCRGPNALGASSPCRRSGHLRLTAGVNNSWFATRRATTH
jgi:hypothetical protein